MEQSEDPRDLERKIEQASRIASRVNDPTTIQRLTAWVEELKQKLQKRRDARRSKEKIRVRAHELWEQHGRPVGRDEEFWLQAEFEIKEGRRE
jgi:FtsZ-binding cell division protein ZapB